MHISPISFGYLPPKYREDIEIDYSKKNGGIPEDVPDDAVVGYGSLDNSYRFSITAGQVRENAKKLAAYKAQSTYKPCVCEDCDAHHKAKAGTAEYI